ncbi:MAG: type I secretion system permease/ATPase [Burkholderiales bacterium]|nr:type I secretion system permease/ATPase [Burkholderiales bacterium]
MQAIDLITQNETGLNVEHEQLVQSDPLLVCLALMTELLDHPISMSVLKSGFALDSKGHVPAAAIPDVAARYGIKAVWLKQRASAMPNYAMPVIAPLIDGRVAIIRSIKNGVVDLLFAETGMRSQQLDVKELEGLLQESTLAVKLMPKTSKQSLLPIKEEAFGWFWNTMWRFRRFYYEAMVATVVANVLTLATVFFAMTVFNRVIPIQAITSLWTLTIGVTIAMLLEFGMRWLKAMLVDEGGKRADLAVNATLLREIMSVRLDHRPQSIGIFASSMRDFDALRDFMSSSLFVTVADLPFVVLFLLVIWLIAGPLVLIPLVVLILLIIVSFAVQPTLMRAMRENMKQAGEKQSVLVESLLNLEMLKAHNAENYLQRRWEKSNAAAVSSFMKIRRVNAWVSGFTTTLSQATTVAMLVLGVFMIIDNTLTIGALIAVNILVGRILGPVSQTVQLATRYQQAKNALEMLDGLVRRPRDRNHDQRYLTPQSFEGHLVADNLEFSYPGPQPALVIDKVSVALGPGEHLALLGPVGCGKSTLLRLLSGLYKPSSGSVRIDNLDMLQLEPSELRNRIGYVGQEAQLFMGSLRENLVLSDTWITDERIMEALTSLGLHAMVASHPRGLDMPLTEAGGGLSGGQRQLLAVVRMMLRDPVYVFMDEPTANMDQDTEARVIRVLGEWLKGRTLVISTHRPQLLAWVDRIVVMHKGAVASQGPRDEILQKLTRNPARSSRAFDRRDGDVSKEGSST